MIDDQFYNDMMFVLTGVIIGAIFMWFAIAFEIIRVFTSGTVIP